MNESGKTGWKKEPERNEKQRFLLPVPGYLDSVTGVYQTSKSYYVDDADVAAFDRQSPPRDKLNLPGQLFD